MESKNENITSLICENCGTKMTLLFIHAICDRCNPPKNDANKCEVDDPDRYGFIVGRARVGSLKYVFPTPEEAIKYRYKTYLSHNIPIFKVKTVSGIFCWYFSSFEVTLSDRFIAIYGEDWNEYQDEIKSSRDNQASSAYIVSKYSPEE